MAYRRRYSKFRARPRRASRYVKRRTAFRRAPFRRRRAPARGRRRVSSIPSVSQPSAVDHPFFRVQIDPFNRDNFNARVPDDSTAPSSSFYLQDEGTLGNNNSAVIGTNGANAMILYPNAFVTGAVGTSVTSTTWTWQSFGTAANNIVPAKTTAVQAQYRVVRPVAHGVRLSCGLAPTTTTGFVHICLYSMSNFGQTNWTAPTSIAQMQGLPYYKKIPLASLTQTPVIICNKYLDQTAFRYVDTLSSEVATAAGTFVVVESWMTVVICVEGAGLAAGGIGSGISGMSTVLNWESICHYEGQSQFGGLTQDIRGETPNAILAAATAETVSRVDAVHATDAASTQFYLSDAAMAFLESLRDQLEPGVSHAIGAVARGVGNAVGSAASNLIGQVSMPGLPGINSAARQAIEY